MSGAMSNAQKVVILLVVVAIAVLWGVWWFTGQGLEMEYRYSTKWKIPYERTVEDPLFGGPSTETVFVDKFVLGLDAAIGGSALLVSFLIGGMVFHALRRA